MKIDCLLVHTPKIHNFYKLIGSHMYCMLMPMGLFAIGDMVAKEGLRVQIMHLGVEKIEDPMFSFKDYLRLVRPKVVGLSLHWHLQSYDVIQLAKEAKSFSPDIFVVLGGFTASYFHREIMDEFSCVDAIIRGDGEVPFLELSREVAIRGRDLSKVPNLTWRDEGETRANRINYVAKDEDLSNLNFTNMELLKNYPAYRDISTLRPYWINGLSKMSNLALCYPKYKAFPISISRGCPVNCTYCGGGSDAQELINGRRGIAVRSVEKVVGSIKEVRRYGYDTIHINYLPFGGKPYYFQELFYAIKDEGIKINCIMECWSLPPKEVIAAYKKTFTDHRFSIIISPESASENTRKACKGFYFSNEELFEFLTFTKEAEISVSLFFNIGLPGETLGDFKRTSDFQRKLVNRFGRHVSCQTATAEIDPASPACNNPGKFGITRPSLSFQDYFNTHSLRNNSPFSAYRIACCTRANNKILKSERMNIDLSKKQIQGIVCNEFCPLSNLICVKFRINNLVFARKAINLLSRVCCNAAFLYWKLRSLITKCNNKHSNLIQA